jgi:2,3-bisphosphoglycerate-independent phosphoglycerate mutase
VIGRYYAMDRDNRWERVEPAYNLLTDAEAPFTATTPVEALQMAYERDESDEFVQATVVSRGENVRMEDGDAVIYMNFRADRARQLTRAFTDSNFDNFERNRTPNLSSFTTLTEYAADIAAPCAFAPESITNSLGEYVASLGKSQLRLAETEKYAHVTFFFSGGREETFEGEDRLLIPSPKVATYDLQPEMSAVEVTDALVEAIASRKYELIVCNYANGDMVGHTGNLSASIEAVQCVDACLGRVVEALDSVQGQCLVTADHGNVEQLMDHDTSQPHTAHTSELVPLVYIGPQEIELNPSGGVLSDVSPTLLALMDLPQPTEMTGQPLLVSNKIQRASN